MIHVRFRSSEDIVYIPHYADVIMTKMASQITSLAVVYSTVYSDADQIKHQSSVSLAFVWRIHRDRWILRTKGQLRGKCFHLMTSSCCQPKALYACTEFWVISCLWKKKVSNVKPSLYWLITIWSIVYLDAMIIINTHHMIPNLPQKPILVLMLILSSVVA